MEERVEERVEGPMERGRGKKVELVWRDEAAVARALDEADAAVEEVVLVGCKLAMVPPQLARFVHMTK